MKEHFFEKVEQLNNTLNSFLQKEFKRIAIENFKKELGIDGYVGTYYYNLIKSEKTSGVVYTPIEIISCMLKNMNLKEKIMGNAFYKICDPACGSGNILLETYIYIREVYLNNLHEINKENGLNIKEEEINDHIIENNIYGYDIDSIALKILSIDMFCISGCITNNIYLKDFLIEDTGKFSCFIGNPPYIGHKSKDKEYGKKLKELYGRVYKDKGDISYCFFEKALKSLEEKGSLSFITSRYFMESPSGVELRKMLKEDCIINKIVDFYGIRPFTGVGIDPLIIFLHKIKGFKEKNNISVIKPRNNSIKKGDFLRCLLEESNEEYKNFFIEQGSLKDENWSLINNDEKTIVDKIEIKCKLTLGDICESYQGIITGCDDAFIVNKESIYTENIEEELLRPWIKSSNIKKFEVLNGEKYIIYSDLIKREEDCINAIKHIKKHEERLKNRREVLKGYRKWYELQWGRNKEIFNETKIIFPYKSNKNKFALDKGNFFSADVYALVLKSNKHFNYSFLVSLLNSKLYEFYFKSFAKKLGGDLYEYYPNNLVKIKIPFMWKEAISEEDINLFFNIDSYEQKLIEDLLCK